MNREYDVLDGPTIELEFDPEWIRYGDGPDGPAAYVGDVGRVRGTAEPVGDVLSLGEVPHSPDYCVDGGAPHLGPCEVPPERLVEPEPEPVEGVGVFTGEHLVFTGPSRQASRVRPYLLDLTPTRPLEPPTRALVASRR